MKYPITDEKINMVFEAAIQINLITIPKNQWIELVHCGIINPDTVLQQIFMTKEEAVKKVHRYAISNLSDGRVGTYVIDQDCADGTKRRNKKASNYEAMIDILYDFYFTPIGKEKKALRICDIFYDWLTYKTRKNGNKDNTIKRNEASYLKYVKGKLIDVMPIRDIRSIDLEEWCIDVLSTSSMTSKMFNTNKIVVMDVLAYAVKLKLITTNPWRREDLDYNKLLNSTRRKPSEEMVFYPDEINSMCNSFMTCYRKNFNSAGIGLIINFDIGLRVGELCALKWRDINWDNETIFIQRMEDASGNVVEYVKADSEAGYRDIVLTKEVISYLKMIKNNYSILSEFIFCHQNGERKTKRQFINKLLRTEESLKFEKLKGTHCIRRTVASRMNASGIPLEEIRRWLGHTDSKTTLTYIYNPFREDRTKEMIRQSSILSTNQKCLQMSSKNKSNFNEIIS